MRVLYALVLVCLVALCLSLNVAAQDQQGVVSHSSDATPAMMEMRAASEADAAAESESWSEADAELAAAAAAEVEAEAEFEAEINAEMDMQLDAEDEGEMEEQGEAETEAEADAEAEAENEAEAEDESDHALVESDAAPSPSPKKMITVEPEGIAPQLPGDKENNEALIKKVNFNLRWAKSIKEADLKQGGAAKEDADQTNKEFRKFQATSTREPLIPGSLFSS